MNFKLQKVHDLIELLGKDSYSKMNGQLMGRMITIIFLLNFLLILGTLFIFSSQYALHLYLLFHGTCFVLLLLYGIFGYYQLTELEMNEKQYEYPSEEHLKNE